MKITRRTFLKFLAGGTAGLLISPLPWKGLGGIAKLTQPGSVPLPVGKEEFKNSISGLCPAKSPVRIRFINGQPVQTQPWPKHPLSGGGISSLAAAEIQNLARPSRLKTPMLRQGNTLVPITWEHALEILTTKLKKAGSSLACATSDSTDVGALLLRDFLKKSGSEHFYRLPGHAQSMDQAAELIGAAGQAGFDIESSDCILSVGADWLESWGPVIYNRNRFFADTKNCSDKKPSNPDSYYIYAGPVANSTARAADEYLQISPGQEIYFLLALARLLALKKSALTNHYQGYAEFVDWLIQLAPEQIYTQDTSLEDTAAKLLKAKRPLVITAGSIGADAHPMLNLLGLSINMLLNNINKPGGITFLPWISGQNTPALTGYLARICLGKLKLPKLIIINQCNPLYSLPVFFRPATGVATQKKNLADIFKSIPFKVALCVFMNETAQECDLVLPVSAALERWEHVYSPAGLAKAYYSIQPPGIAAPKNVPGVASLLTAVRENYFEPLKVDKPAKNEQEIFTQTCENLALTWQQAYESKSFFNPVQINHNLLRFRTDLFNAWLHDDGLNNNTLCDKKNLVPEGSRPETKPAAVKLVPLACQEHLDFTMGLSTFKARVSLERAYDGNNAIAWLGPAEADKLGLGNGEKVVISCPGISLQANVRIDESMPSGSFGLWAGFGHYGIDEFTNAMGHNLFLLYNLAWNENTACAYFEQAEIKLKKI